MKQLLRFTSQTGQTFGLKMSIHEFLEVSFNEIHHIKIARESYEIRPWEKNVLLTCINVFTPDTT